MAESRAEFDPKRAPEGWDYEKQGRPDILFWRYAGEEAAREAKATDVESLWKSDYEVAAEWRDTAIREAEANVNKTAEEEKQPANEHMVDKKPESDIMEKEKDHENVDSKTNNKKVDRLNWDIIVNKKGETRLEHISKHSIPNPSRKTHGVFNGDPQKIIEEAWNRKEDVQPISDGMGGDIYNIPFDNAGYESGYLNTGAKMHYVTIIVMEGTANIITAFPSFGNYLN